ncbi:hypothetical protein [Halodesulfurarchaeum sp.]|uniref:hypothetical protein n=1 Tax=Halodesulfurarchaeum sp. TaxID=1980530 RepID=UPI002FC30B07
MPDISRRAVLQGLTLTGVASVGAGMGVGTYALVSDGSTFRSNVLRSGSLEFEIATLVEYDGTNFARPEQDRETFPTRFTSDRTIELPVPEIDSQGPVRGTTTVAFRACENPARVWLRADGERSALADALQVNVVYSSRCKTSGTTIYDGPLAGFFDQFGSGGLLGSCSTLGKVEVNDGAFVVETEAGTGDSLSVPENIPGELTFDGPDGPTTIRITDVYYKDDSDDDSEVVGVDIASSDVEFCRVDVKGGGKQPTPGSGAGGKNKSSDKPSSGGGSSTGRDSDDGIVTYRPDCSGTASGLLAGETPGGTQSGLSHFTISTCNNTCLGCDPGCLVLDWRLDDPASVAEESLRFDLELFANQCRNTKPTNPWS